MKLIPPSDEYSRHLLKLRIECALAREQGGLWRVDIILGRYGWYARAFLLKRKRKACALPDGLADGRQGIASGPCTPCSGGGQPGAESLIPAVASAR